jgi:hypothetical protein
VLTALRAQRNRPYLRLLALVLLVSWLSLLVFATCSMPAQWRTTSDAMPTGCSEPESHAQGHQEHGPKPQQDCSFKPCLESQVNPGFGYKLDKPQMPAFVLCLSWLVGCLFRHVQKRRIPCPTAPLPGRRIPLIYRFCILLN